MLQNRDYNFCILQTQVREEHFRSHCLTISLLIYFLHPPSDNLTIYTAARIGRSYMLENVDSEEHSLLNSNMPSLLL